MIEAASAITTAACREIRPIQASASSTVGSIPASTSGHCSSEIALIRAPSKRRPSATRSPTTSDQACAIQKTTTVPASDSVIVRADACSSNMAPTSAATRIEP